MKNGLAGSKHNAPGDGPLPQFAQDSIGLRERPGSYFTMDLSCGRQG
jgi:hypothetical protein